MRIRQARAFAMALVFLGGAFGGRGLLARAHAGEADADGAEAFAKGLEAVRDCHKRGQAKKGLATLAALLEKHEGRDDARARLADVRDLARRLSFRAQVKQPDPKSLVSGKLMKWTATTGDIKIRYKRKTAGDLQKSKKSDLLFFPFDVRGPCKLEVKGKHYPKRTEDSPRMIFGGDEVDGEEVSWQITFGVPPYTEGSNEVWLPAIISQYVGDEKTVISKKKITPAKAGKAYKLLLTVTRSSIVPKINGKPIGKARKPKQVYGSISFEARGWTDATFSGRIEPSWMQARVDRVVQKQRAAFERSYDERKVLPAWLFEAPKSAPDAVQAGSGDGRLPEKLGREYTSDLARCFTALTEGDLEGGLEATRTMRKRGAPASVCAYLDAMLNAAFGRTTEALGAITQCTEAAPGFLRGWILKGALLRRLGRREEAMEAYLEGVRRNSRSAAGYEGAALGMLYAGNLTGARKFTQEAARAGVSSKRLTQLAGALVKAERGPTFTRVFENKSRNYHVISDMNQKVCVEATQLLEKAYTSYRVNFSWIKQGKKQKRFKVYLFGGRAGFMAYQEDLQELMGRPAESAAGLYSPLLKQLLIWNLPTREEMFKTIRHEGFHQYLDRIMPDPPTWFNEGLAVYHEFAVVKRGRLTYGQPIDEYVELLQEEGLVPLKTFLVQPSRAFYEGSHRSYGQAWAFLHMLKHGESGHGDLFKKLVEAFQTEEAPVDVLHRVFPDDLLTKLDHELKDYVAKLAGA